MLAHVMPEAFDPQGWLASEKLDGIRALWLPALSREHLFSRAGNPIHAPPAFVQQLPADTPLDGELFHSRGGFQWVSSIVRKRQPVDSEWKQITYHVFDSPGEGTTAQRLDRAAARPPRGRAPRPLVRVLNQTPVRDRPHLDAMLRNVLKGKGEGLMVRDPRARTSTSASARCTRSSRRATPKAPSSACSKGPASTKASSASSSSACPTARPSSSARASPTSSDATSSRPT